MKAGRLSRKEGDKESNSLRLGVLCLRFLLLLRENPWYQ